MTEWWQLADDDPFGIDNLPYGSLRAADGRRFAAVRYGEWALDLTAAAALEPVNEPGLFAGGTLDAFLAAGHQSWSRMRTAVVGWLTQPQHRAVIAPLLVPLSECTVTLGFAVADYVDFYASEAHATNVGRIFRPRSDPLTPNWKHLPIGYHGRAGTVVVSGTDVRRPSGQVCRVDGSVAFGPSERLDLEAEVAFVVGGGTELGEPVSIGSAADHIFGLCLLNDWSARDIQAWEYVPLGPFLGKSFATSIAGWITPLAALSRAWRTPPARSIPPLPYLDDSFIRSGLALRLSVDINGTAVSRPPFEQMYWTPVQMLAHLTANGSSLRPGDVFASGTVSGTGRDERGSLLELTWNGTEPITLGDGTTRCFLQDGDEVVITAAAPGPRGPISLAEVRGLILAAHPGQN